MNQVKAVNRLNHVFERELAIKFELVPNSDLLLFQDTIDGYSNWNARKILMENRKTLDSIVGTDNYDIGHVFTTSKGGYAEVRSICNDSSKAFGTSGYSKPDDPRFLIDYFVHEIGHQLGADHTFSSDNVYCKRYRNDDTAIEPGSGSTIMGYAGICNRDNLQLNSDPYFHNISLAQIVHHLRSMSQSICGIQKNHFQYLSRSCH